MSKSLELPLLMVLESHSRLVARALDDARRALIPVESDARPALIPMESDARRPLIPMDPDARRPLPKAGSAPASRPAMDFPDLRPRLAAFSDEARASIRVVIPGRRLKSGETYLDLNRFPLRPFEAMGALVALRSQRLVAQSETPVELWQRLLT